MISTRNSAQLLSSLRWAASESANCTRVRECCSQSLPHDTTARLTLAGALTASASLVHDRLVLGAVRSLDAECVAEDGVDLRDWEDQADDEDCPHKVHRVPLEVLAKRVVQAADRSEGQGGAGDDATAREPAAQDHPNQIIQT